jgi:hypothetical protein
MRWFYLWSGLFWFVMCSLLLVQVYFNPEKQRFGKNTVLIAILGLVMSLYFLVRWWALRARAKARDTELPPRKRPVNPDEYHPEFDFSRPDSPGQTNGQKKE